MKRKILFLLAFIPVLLLAQSKHKTGVKSHYGHGPIYNDGERKLYQFIANHLKYPDSARHNNITGVVFINFDVDIHGKVHNFRVVKKVDTNLDKEALRVAESIPDDWSPAVISGHTLEETYTLTVKFKLP